MIEFRVIVDPLPRRGGGPALTEQILTLCRELPPSGAFCEIGVWLGANILSVAATYLHVHCIGVDSMADAKDLFGDGEKWMATLQEWGWRLRVGDRVTWHRNDSVEWLKQTKERFGVVFIDGYHSPEQVYAELSLSQRLLEPPFIMSGHDYTQVGTGVERFVKDNPQWVINRQRPIFELRRE